MTCKDVLDRLQSYVVGEVSEDERLSIQNHLASCEECRREERIMRWLVVTLDSDVIAEPSPLFVQSVMKRLKERPALVPARVMPGLVALAIGGLSLVGYLFREAVFKLAGGLQVSVAKIVSGLPLEIPLAESLLPRMGSIYLISLAFASLLLTVAVVWFVRYYWEPVERRAEQTSSR